MGGKRDCWRLKTMLGESGLMERELFSPEKSKKKTKTLRITSSLSSKNLTMVLMAEVKRTLY